MRWLSSGGSGQMWGEDALAWAVEWTWEGVDLEGGAQPLFTLKTTTCVPWARVPEYTRCGFRMVRLVSLFGCQQRINHIYCIYTRKQWIEQDEVWPCVCGLVAQSGLTLVTPWPAGRQASMSITNSRGLLKLMSIESVMPSNHRTLVIPFSSAFNQDYERQIF